MTYLSSLIYVTSMRRAVVAIFAVGILCSQLNGTTSAQQFYPNGRYGRAGSVPPLADISSGREMTVAFFGDGTVKCVYTGFQDYYKCGRIENPLDSPTD